MDRKESLKASIDKGYACQGGTQSNNFISSSTVITSLTELAES